jgi:hypothetical protein
MKRWIAHPRPRATLPAALITLITILAAHAAMADAPRVATPAARPASTHAQAKRARATSTHHKPTRPASGTLVRASGMKAAIDPTTGRLVRPTAEQIQALDAQAGVQRATDDDPSRGIPVIRLANGAELAQLDGRFQEFEVARVGADGKLVRSCVQGEGAAAKFRADAKAKPAAPKPAREVQ